MQYTATKKMNDKLVMELNIPKFMGCITGEIKYISNPEYSIYVSVITINYACNLFFLYLLFVILTKSTFDFEQKFNLL